MKGRRRGIFGIITETMRPFPSPPNFEQVKRWGRNIGPRDMSNEAEQTVSAVSRSPFAVELRGLEHRFGTRRVFGTVEARIEAGQVCAITGANGAGKSTLLRIVAGLLLPLRGEANVSMQGERLDALTRRAFIGYVAPDLTLYRELTGAENLQFFARLRGISLSREDLIERLTEVGLRGRGKDFVGTYSSGMRQRLKYAFALLARPPILLLDEPTANLDEAGAAIVKNIIEAQRTRPGSGLTILATNEPNETQWGDTLIRLEPGN